LPDAEPVLLIAVIGFGEDGYLFVIHFDWLFFNW